MVHFSSDDWTVGLYQNGMLFTICHDRTLLAKRMYLPMGNGARTLRPMSIACVLRTYLYLIHRWHFEPGILYLFQMFDPTADTENLDSKYFADWRSRTRTSSRHRQS